MAKTIQIKVYRPITLPTAFMGAKAQITPPVVLKPKERDEGIANKFDPIIHDVDVGPLGYESAEDFKGNWFIANLIKDGDIEIVSKA